MPATNTRSARRIRWAIVLTALVGLATAPLSRSQSAPPGSVTPAPNTPSVARSGYWPSLAGTAPARQRELFIRSALGQVGVTLYYDPSYVSLTFPGGDVPPDRGVCTDVVVRAMRALGIDLQQEVNRDMRQAFAAYPRNWGLRRPDPNIDHRRVPNLMTFFARQGKARPPSTDPEAFLPGDVVAWRLSDGRPHIGILTDRPSASASRWLAVHNIGEGARLEDVLFAFTIIGHYRLFPWQERPQRPHGPRRGRDTASPSAAQEGNTMFMEQLEVGHGANFTYVFGTGEGGEGFVVDPAWDADRILACIKTHRLDVTRIVLTHHHHDHINAAASIKARTGAKILAHSKTQGLLQGSVAIDGTIGDGEGFTFGDREVRVIHTPGHTPGGICLVVGDRWLVTGDSLFIDNCGRTDLPGGDVRQLFDSLQKLKGLPDTLQVLPGHDYGSVPSRTLGAEKQANPTLRAASLEEFQAIP